LARIDEEPFRPPPRQGRVSPFSRGARPARFPPALPREHVGSRAGGCSSVKRASGAFFVRYDRPALAQMPEIPAGSEGDIGQRQRSSANRGGSRSPALCSGSPRLGSLGKRGLPSLSCVSVTARPRPSRHIIWGHISWGRIIWRRLISGGRHAAPGQHSHAAKLCPVQSISHTVGRAAASPVMVTSMMHLVHISAAVRVGVRPRLLGFRSRLCGGRRA
jgi:hypothetical protein